MNGEEDERERTRNRRVETEHDRDERGVGVAGSGRLHPSSPRGLPTPMDFEQENSLESSLS